MARHSRLSVYQSLLQQIVVPLFHHPDPDTAVNIVDAIAAGGGRVIEFTNRGDGAHEVFASVERHCRAMQPDVVLGAGSVVDPGTAALYLNLGASFIVSPTFDADVARVCNRRKVAYMPGCMTPTEMAHAETAGCEIVKYFPGDAGSPSFISAILGPSPWTSIMPTGGVEPTEPSLRSWLGAGAVCVGIGSKLVRRDLVADANWSQLTELVRSTLDTAAAIRGQDERA